MIVQTGRRVSGRKLFMDTFLKTLEEEPEDLRASFPEFFKRYPPNPDYLFGRHTMHLLEGLQEITEKLERGECTYRIYTLPFRHGKSDPISRRYGPWHLSRNPDHDVILGAYNTDLATDFSFQARNILNEASHDLGGIRVHKTKAAIGSWKIEGHNGGFFATGIRGTITGRGANLMVLDDYLKSREEAESLTIRDKIWAAFQSDLFTRLAPVHALVIAANRWHVDDLVGRIKNRNNPNHPDYDPDFPVFEEVIFPAQSDDYKTEDNERGWLFPERFTDAWYRAQKAALGQYAWQAQALGNPQPRTGNFLRVDKVQIVDSIDDPRLLWKRGWDLASTEKERAKQDPDFTVGTKSAYREGTLYIKDVVRGQWGTTRRDEIMEATMVEDGPGIEQRIEAVAGYTDTRRRFQDRFRGSIKVTKKSPRVDKVANASILEPLFDASKVVIERGAWNDVWLTEFGAFPSGPHDDQVDSLVVASGDEIRQRVTEIRNLPWGFGRSYA